MDLHGGSKVLTPHAPEIRIPSLLIGITDKPTYVPHVRVGFDHQLDGSRRSPPPHRPARPRLRPRRRPLHEFRRDHGRFILLCESTPPADGRGLRRVSSSRVQHKYWGCSIGPGNTTCPRCRPSFPPGVLLPSREIRLLGVVRRDHALQRESDSQTAELPSFRGRHREGWSGVSCTPVGYAGPPIHRYRGVGRATAGMRLKSGTASSRAIASLTVDPRQSKEATSGLGRDGPGHPGRDRA